MKKRIFPLIALTLLISLNSSAFAANETKKNVKNKNGLPCPVSGIVPLQQYVRARDRQCFKKAAQAESQGLFAFDENTDQSDQGKNKRCKYLAVKGDLIYFSSSNVRCFKNTKRAEAAGFTPYVVKPNPTLTPFPQGTPTPSGTPITGGDVTSFSFILGPTTPGSGYTGSCTSELNGSHTQITITCTHNVMNASEAHLHIVPDNDKYCALEAPAPTFTMVCALTTDLGDRIAAGNGLVAIHLAPGGAGQAVAGLMR